MSRRCDSPNLQHATSKTGHTLRRKQTWLPEAATAALPAGFPFYASSNSLHDQPRDNEKSVRSSIFSILRLPGDMSPKKDMSPDGAIDAMAWGELNWHFQLHSFLLSM